MTNAMLHSLLELAGVACCLVIAWRFVSKYREFPSGLYAFWALAWATTAMEDTVHAVVSFYLPTMIEHWVPWTWGTARLTLAIMLITASVLSARAVSIRAGVLSGVAMMAGSMALIALPVGFDISWVYTESWLIHRPFDFSLMLLWLALALQNWRSGTTSLQLPAHGVRFFLWAGVAVEAIMATSSYESLDPGFMLAHFAKLAEYAMIAYLCWLDLEESRAAGGTVELLRRRANLSKKPEDERAFIDALCAKIESQ